jgi:nuclear pore complex protein Nup214
MLNYYFILVPSSDLIAKNECIYCLMEHLFVVTKDLFCFIEQINEMTKELDTLLSYIEKDGGFRDACITFRQGPLSMFEDGLQNFSELLQIFKVA